MKDETINIPSHFCVLVCFRPFTVEAGKGVPYAFLGIDNKPRRTFDTAAVFASRDEAVLRRQGLEGDDLYVILEVGDIAALDGFIINPTSPPPKPN